MRAGSWGRDAAHGSCCPCRRGAARGAKWPARKPQRRPDATAREPSAVTSHRRGQTRCCWRARWPLDLTAQTARGRGEERRRAGSGWRTPRLCAALPAALLGPPLRPWVPLGAEGFWRRSYFFSGRSLWVGIFFLRGKAPGRPRVSLGHLASREVALPQGSIPCGRDHTSGPGPAATCAERTPTLQDQAPARGR